MQVISVSNDYASALRRLAAFIIDWLVIWIAINLLIGPFYGHVPFGMRPFVVMQWGIRIHELDWLSYVIVIAYFSIMESSKYQGTLGKIVLHIKVTDKSGQRVPLPKAILRNLSKIISTAILGIGYIMIIFDEHKQGLHDKIADTLVVRQ